MALPNIENYGYYKELAQTGYQVIRTSDLNDDNIDQHFDNILAILDDGIETDFVQHMKVHVIFGHGECDFYIMQYMYNLIFWPLITRSHKEIDTKHIIFEPIVKTDWMLKYINKFFIRKNLRTMDRITMNQSIDRCIGKFIKLQNYQMFLANSVDFADTIELMKKYPDFNATIHTDLTGIPMQDIKEYIMKNAKTQYKYITAPDSHHNQKYAFQTGEGTNLKQYAEVCVAIGAKPDGKGGLFTHPINHSFINGGLQSIEDVVIDSSIGRIAQIISKQNVGQSGAFARRLGLNNMDSFLNPDPNYSCDTKNLEEVYIKDKDMLDMFDMRYYRTTMDGPERILNADVDKNLIGQTLLFRSPITCASAAKGYGICYRCYGLLAYLNNDINIGQIAAEQLSSRYTQKLLSAKHLLEASVVKMTWTQEFYELFSVEYDRIILKDNIDYRKYKLIIDPDDIIDEADSGDDDETDDIDPDNNDYIYSFKVQYPDGHIASIYTNESDPIYFDDELIEVLNNEDTNDDGIYVLQLSKMINKAIFYVDIQNNELSKTMKQIKNLIDNKASIKTHDRNTILQDFITYNLAGGIKINSVHFEVLLSNQIRNPDDILLMPDWEQKNAGYQLIRLEDAIVNSSRISTRLQGSKLKRTLTHASNHKLYKAGNLDLFAMERPQDFINPKLVDRSHDAPERKIIKPVYFTDDLSDTGITKNGVAEVTKEEVKEEVDKQLEIKKNKK